MSEESTDLQSAQDKSQKSETISAEEDSNAAVTEMLKSGHEDVAEEVKVVYKFCDINKKMVEEWKKYFDEYIPDRIEVYQGDIFKDGPAADAIVSPANSFGFMDGGIDMAYSKHFGWQMQERLQEKIIKDHHGELLVGEAVIIPTLENWRANTVDWGKFNGGQPIKWLVSAPTMRVPMDVDNTANAYLSFRAVILAVEKFNKCHPQEPIRSVLCPGMGTAVGRMPPERCAIQMLKAFENFVMNLNPQIIKPLDLSVPISYHINLIGIGNEFKKE